MTLTAEPPVAVTAAPPPLGPPRGLAAPGAPRWRRRARAARMGELGVALPLLLVMVTFALRAVDVASAYDVNGDEVNYATLTLSLRDGYFPPRFAGAPFLLHPPGFFALGALWGDALGITGNYFHQLNALRMLNVVAATVAALLVYALGTRLAGRTVGAGAALVYAFDPYILRQNERVLLETSTLMFILAGYLMVLSYMEGRARRPRLCAVTGGLLLGLAIVDKDIAAILVLVPLAFMLRRNEASDRRLVGTTLAVSVVPYLVYVILLGSGGYFSSFIAQETLGLRRQLGLVQVTGFNAQGSPSLLSTAIHQMSQFGVTYLLSGLGVIASIYLLVRHRRPGLRLWAVVTLCGTGSLGYSVLFGTIEEQMLYFMYVPAIVALLAGMVIFARERAQADPVRNHRIRRAVAWAVIAFCAYDATVWFSVRSTPDNGNARVVAWFATHEPSPGIIGTNTDVTTNLLVNAGFNAIDLGDPATGARDHIRFLTILSASLVGNYGTFDTAQAGFFEHYGHLVFSYHEPTYGTISIWETTNPAIW